MKHWHLTEHLNNGNIIFAMWSSVLTFLAPIGWWLGACAFMVIADFITGCWAARKRGEMWKSAKFRDSIYKCGTYMFVIICARIFESVLPAYTDPLEISRLFSGAIVGVEFYSVLENMYKLTGNRVFYLLTQVTSKKLKEKIGEDIKEE